MFLVGPIDGDEGRVVVWIVRILHVGVDVHRVEKTRWLILAKGL